jgi:hypothetical protein
MPKATINKSDFIRSQPTTMSPSEVIAKGKSEGLRIGRSLVYMVRGRNKKKSKMGGAQKTPPVTDEGAGVVQSKADLVRSLPQETPMKEIVPGAAAAGTKPPGGHVQEVRRRHKTAGKKRSRRGAPTKPVSKQATATNGGSTSAATTSRAEDLLKAVAAELGLGRAMEILAGERARVRNVIGG